MGTKKNPGKFDCYTKASDDEPVFVLLARDPVAPTLIRIWNHLREMSGCSDSNDKKSEALRTACLMEQWAVKKENQLVNLIENCVCGHTKLQHNTLQDFAYQQGSKLGPAQKPEYRHCKECKCQVFKNLDM